MNCFFIINCVSFFSLEQRKKGRIFFKKEIQHMHNFPKIFLKKNTYSYKQRVAYSTG